MRAGTLDVYIETGALWARDLQVYAPDTPVPASTVVPDQRVFLDGRPQLVHNVVTTGAKTTITFGQGLWYEPQLTVPYDALVAPAVPVPILDAAAAWTYLLPGVPVVNPLDPAEAGVKYNVPWSLSTDQLTLTLGYTADETQAFRDLAGAYSWDCFVQTSTWDWQRVVEGTWTIIRSDAR